METISPVKWNVLVTPPGGFGLAMCMPFLNNGHEVTAGFRDQEKADKFSRTYTDEILLSGVQLPPTLKVTADLGSAVRQADLIVLAPPSAHLRKFYQKSIMPYMREDALLLCVTKGLEQGTNLRPSQVIESVDPGVMPRYAVMGGPNLARDVARALPMVTHIASQNIDVAKHITDGLFQVSPKRFRAYPTDDVIGVEIGSATKGVYAIGAGISDGLGLEDSTRSSFIDRAFAEMLRINELEGGKERTLGGPSGHADLQLCSTSSRSRNYQAGLELANGRTREQILASGKTYEGFNTAKALVKLAHSHELMLPISQGIYAVVYGLVTVEEAVASLLETDRFI